MNSLHRQPTQDLFKISECRNHRCGCCLLSSSGCLGGIKWEKVYPGSLVTLEAAAGQVVTVVVQVELAGHVPLYNEGKYAHHTKPTTPSPPVSHEVQMQPGERASEHCFCRNYSDSKAFINLAVITMRQNSFTTPPLPSQVAVPSDEGVKGLVASKILC